MGFGPETLAIIKELRLLRQSLTGIYEPTEITLRGGIHHEQERLDKSAAFTATRVRTEGFNLIQISSDGNLLDITYQIEGLSGKPGDTINAALSPHVVGHTLAVLVTNAGAEGGKYVYVDKYLAPWPLLAAIKHGTLQAVSVTAGKRAFYAEQVEYASSALNYFESDQPLGTTPTLSFVGSPAIQDALIHTIKWQFTPTNAVTYRLYLLQDAQAVDERSESDIFFDSGAGLAGGSINIQVAGGSPSKLPVHVRLATAGTIYYLIDWSAAPGDTTGYIKVYGEALS